MRRTVNSSACELFAVLAVAVLRPAARAREWRTDHPHQPRRRHAHTTAHRAAAPRQQ